MAPLGLESLHRRRRRVVERVLRSPRVPFWFRSRLLWRKTHGAWIARRPETFSGKVRWKMLKDRRPLLTTFADKVAARDYVARTVGPQYLTETYAIVDDVSAFDHSRLPREFVAKTNHGSGGVWIVSEHAPEGMRVEGYPADAPVDLRGGWYRVLIRPDELDRHVFRATLGSWLAKRRSDENPEWAYVDIQPRILVEELLEDESGELALDYKFFVFHGRAEVVQVVTGRFGDHRQNMYRPDWTLIDVRYDYPRYPRILEEVPPPPGLDEMLEVAGALGRETDFVRVDLYNLDGRIVFGELTNYPDAGTVKFAPDSFDADLGRLWTLPRSYRRFSATTLAPGGATP